MSALPLLQAGMALQPFFLLRLHQQWGFSEALTGKALISQDKLAPEQDLKWEGLDTCHQQTLVSPTRRRDGEERDMAAACPAGPSTVTITGSQSLQPFPANWSISRFRDPCSWFFILLMPLQERGFPSEFSLYM